MLNKLSEVSTSKTLAFLEQFKKTFALGEYDILNSSMKYLSEKSVLKGS